MPCDLRDRQPLCKPFFFVFEYHPPCVLSVLAPFVTLSCYSQRQHLCPCTSRPRLGGSGGPATCPRQTLCLPEAGTRPHWSVACALVSPAVVGPVVNECVNFRAPRGLPGEASAGFTHPLPHPLRYVFALLGPLRGQRKRVSGKVSEERARFIQATEPQAEVW